MRPVFNIVNPGYLLVSDRPLAASGEIKRLDTEEINDKFNFNYAEDIFLPEAFVDVEFGHTEGREFIWGKIKDRLEHPLNDKLIVCFINSEVGYGVFAKEFIPAGTIIGVYAGEIDSTDNDDKDYGMIFHPTFRINARQTGGIARFIQHLPYFFEKIVSEIKSSPDIDVILRILDGNGIFFEGDDDLRTIDLIRKSGSNSKYLEKFALKQIEELNNRTVEEQAEIKTKSFLNKIPNLATANVQQYPIQFKNLPAAYLQTLCDIQPNEQLGITYGLTYWNKKGHAPQYFDRLGQIIQKNTYMPSLEEIVMRHKKTDELHLPTSETALRRAAAKGNKQDVEFLLEHGALVNAADENPGSKRTALHWAAERGFIDIVELLIDRGGETNIIDASNKTPVDCNPGIFEIDTTSRFDHT